MKTVTTYLSFDGNCRQAMSFYRECLATELEVNLYPDASGQRLSRGRRSCMPNYCAEAHRS
jgi:uncharacterized glyoxalase superfamily protein PhnB